MFGVRRSTSSPKPAIALPPSDNVVVAEAVTPQLLPDKQPPTAATTPKAHGASSSIVRFDSAASQQSFISANNLIPDELKQLPNLNAYRVERDSVSLTTTAGSVTYPNIRYTAQATTPNDPAYSAQWYASKVNQPSAWDLTTGSSSTTVAVIDTGFALAHVDFTGRWSTNGSEIGTTASQGVAPNCTSRSLTLDKSCNNLDDDGNGLKDDWRGWDFDASDNSPQAGDTNPTGSSLGHGSLVTGLIGATGNDSMGIAGSNWSAKLLPLQALDDDGIGYTDSVASAVHYAADRGAKVINLSLGADIEDVLLKAEVDRAISMGAIVVAAAGNTNCGCLLYPANYPDVIAVGASDTNDNRASWSTYGANLDLVAPGTSICSDNWSQANQTTLVTCGHAGTSFAAPLVSGAISLMVARAPDLVASDINRILAQTSTTATQFNIYTGFGRLDTYQAVLAASLDTPSGQVTNKHVTYLNNGTSLALGPLMNSTCQTLPSASCELKLTGPSSQVVSLGTKPADTEGVVSFYWNAATLGLATGLWRVDAIATYNGQTTTQTDYVTIHP